MPDSKAIITAEPIEAQVPENRTELGRFKPGQSGNPGGRPKKLTRILDVYLDSKDAKGNSKAQKFVKAIVERAIKKSDILAKEVWDRAEGKMPSEDRAQTNVQVVVMSGR